MCTYLHGLDIVTAHPVYRTVFLPAIRTSDRFLVNSENTKNLAANANIDEGSIHVLHPGVSIPDDESQEAETQLFRRLIDAQDRPILLSVGRLTTRKGIAEFIEQGLLEIARQVPDVLYVIIGEEPRQATSNRGRGLAERIRKTARTHGLEKHVRLLGRVEDDVLEQAYFGSQAHVFPVLEQAGDVEGFGMVAIEAAAHGLPTIAFAVGGIPDAVSEGRSGYLVASGDYPAMTARIVSTLKRNEGTPSASDCRQFALQFSWQSFSENLRRELLGMLD